MVVGLCSAQGYEVLVDEVRDWYQNDSITHPIFIGGNINELPSLDAVADDIRIYGRALTAQEVADLYNELSVSSTDLLAQWNFEEGSGSSILDSSGNGHNGSFYPGSTPTWTTGKTGLGLDLSQNIVEIPRDPALLPGSAITLSVWVKPDRIRANRWIVNKFGRSQYGLQFIGSGGSNLRFHLHVGSSAHLELAITPSELTDGDWHLITATYDGANRRIYIDGVEQISDSVTGAIRYIPFGANSGNFGAYSMEAVGDTVYVGLAGDRPNLIDGATLARINENSLEHVGFIYEQGFSEMLYKDGTLYIPGADPAFGQSWALGNVYFYDHVNGGPVVLKRTQPRSIHTHRISVDDEGAIYTGIHTRQSDGQFYNQLIKSTDDGDSWEILNSHIYSERHFTDILENDGRLYLNDGRLGTFEYSDDDALTWNVIGSIEGVGLYLLDSWQERVVGFKSINSLANTTTFNIATGITNQVSTVEGATLAIWKPVDGQTVQPFNPFVTSPDGYLYMITDDNRIVRVSPPQAGSPSAVLDSVTIADLNSDSDVPSEQGLLSIEDWPAENALLVASRGTHAKIFKITKPTGLIADAGVDRSVLIEEAPFILSGSSSANDTASFTWSEVSGPIGAEPVVFSDVNDRNSSVTFAQVGEYVLQFAVNDGGDVATDTMTFDVTSLTTDEDGDGFFDYIEIELYGDLTTSNGNTDFDNDGVSDKDELLAGRDLQGLEVATIPFEDFFERDPAELHHENYWNLFGSGSAMIEDASEGGRELKLSSFGNDLYYLYHFFEDNGVTVKWTDLDIRPAAFDVGSEPNLLGNTTVAFFFNKAGYLVVRDGDAWVEQNQVTPVDLDSHQRVTVRQDYIARTWSIWLNLVMIAEDLQFNALSDESTSLAGLFISQEAGTTALFDNLSIRDEAPDDFITAPAPVLLSAVSRQNHEGTDYDLALPLSEAAGIECRDVNGSLQLVLTFDEAILAGTVGVHSGLGTLASSPVIEDNTVTVHLSNVADEQWLTVRLSDFITSAYGAAMEETDLTIGLLKGDVDGSGSVNLGDILKTRAVSGHSLDSGNAHYDFDMSGTLNVGDPLQMRAYSGNHLTTP